MRPAPSQHRDSIILDFIFPFMSSSSSLQHAFNSVRHKALLKNLRFQCTVFSLSLSLFGNIHKVIHFRKPFKLTQRLRKLDALTYAQPMR